MQQKPLPHDRLLSECHMHLWNTYPQTRYTSFHVTNESKPVHKEALLKLVISVLKAFSLFVPSDKLQSFIFQQQYSKEHIIELSRMKAIGVVPGVLDYIWYWGNKMYAFDIKVGKDVLSDSQRSFISAIEKQGGECFIISSLQQFKEIVITLI